VHKPASVSRAQSTENPTGAAWEQTKHNSTSQESTALEMISACVYL